MITKTIVRSKTVACIIILLSIAVGIAVYSLSAFKPSTLVLDAKALEKGVGQVFVHNSETGVNATVDFEILDGNSRESMHVIELPAIMPESLRLAPLSRKGSFEIHRITLENDAISYIWDFEGNCTQKQFVQGALTRETCKGAYPGITVAEDSSVLISSIPDNGIRRTSGARFVIGAVSALMFLMSAAWMLRPHHEKGHTLGFPVYAVRAAWLVFIFLYMYQFLLICRYSVDVPYHDEWYYFLPDALSRKFSLGWIFRQHVDHVIAPTKLMAWLNLELFNLDFRLQKMLNFLIFGGMLGTVIFLKNRIVGKQKFVFFPLFMIFLLSPINQENHRWAFQSQIHLVLLFSNLALCYAFTREHTWKTVFMFSLFSVLSIYTFASGVIFVSCCIAFIVIYTAADNLNKPVPERWRLVSIMGLIAGSGLLAWAYTYKKPADKMFAMATYVLPSEPNFWVYFLNQLSLSFGFKEYSIIPGMILLGFIVAPIMLLLLNRDKRYLQSTWTVLTAVAYTLALLVAISMTRTYVDASGAKTSRYFEVFGLLIPYMVLAWWLVFESKKWRSAFMVIFWCGCFISFYGTWSPKVYQFTRQIDFLTLDCVERDFAGNGRDACQGIATPEHLSRAKNLGVKFTHQFSTVRQ